MTCRWKPAAAVEFVGMTPHYRGSPWNWIPVLGVKKLEWWCYRANKEVWRYHQPSG